MIDAPVHPTASSSEKIVEVIENFERDEFGYFLENDPELQIAYEACMKAAGIEWTDEEIAECVYATQYGERVNPLVQYWRQQQALLNKADPEHARAAAVHIAVMKWKRRQSAQRPVLAQGIKDAS